MTFSTPEMFVDSRRAEKLRGAILPWIPLTRLPKPPVQFEMIGRWVGIGGATPNAFRPTLSTQRENAAAGVPAVPAAHHPCCACPRECNFPVISDPWNRTSCFHDSQASKLLEFNLLEATQSLSPDRHSEECPLLCFPAW